MVIYFSSTAPSGLNYTKTLKDLDEFQVWYGRTNYWMKDLSKTITELDWCVSNNISGYMINLCGWNNSTTIPIVSESNVSNIINSYEQLRKACEIRGLWLVVTLYNGIIDNTISTETLDNKLGVPKSYLIDSIGSPVELEVTVDNHKVTGLSSSATLSHYSSKPEIIISSSPVEGYTATATASISNGVLTATIKKQGNYYCQNLGAGISLYESLARGVLAKGINNVLITPISNFDPTNSDHRLFHDKVIEIFNNYMDHLIYSDNVNSATGVTFGYTRIHPTNSEDIQTYYAGKFAISSPRTDSLDCYGDLLEIRPTFYFNNDKSKQMVTISGVSAGSNVDYLINGLPFTRDNISGITQYSYEKLDGHKVYIRFVDGDYYFSDTIGSGDSCILYPNKLDGNYQYLIKPGATSSTPSNKRYSIINGRFEQKSNGTYYESSDVEDRFKMTVQDATVYVSVDKTLVYSDELNKTDESKLNLWLSRMKNTGVKVVGYDAFYRVTPEKSIFSILNPDNF